MVPLILVTLAVLPVFAEDEDLARYIAYGEDDRIIGGVPAAIDEFPFIVHLHITFSEEYESFFVETHLRCGGTIITEDWVLTATHCVDPKLPSNSVLDRIEVRAGSSYTDRGGVTRSVEETVARDYPPDDIALIKVDEPWPFNGITISLARLPRQDDPIPVYERATIMGWGAIDLQETPPERLMKQEVLVISLEYCRSVYLFWWPYLKKTKYQVTAKMICTLFDPAKTPSIAYKGDSGSPVMVNGEVVGIESWVQKTVYAPNVHTRVSSYIDWIEEHVGPLPRAE